MLNMSYSHVVNSDFLYSQLAHPHIVQFLGVSFNENDPLQLNAYIVMRYVAGYNLHEVIFKKKMVSRRTVFGIRLFRWIMHNPRYNPEDLVVGCCSWAHLQNPWFVPAFLSPAVVASIFKKYRVGCDVHKVPVKKYTMPTDANCSQRLSGFPNAGWGRRSTAGCRTF